MADTTRSPLSLTPLDRATKDPNRDIRVGRAYLYPREVWWFIVVVIFALGLFHWVPRLVRLILHPSPSRQLSPPRASKEDEVKHATDSKRESRSSQSSPPSSSVFTGICNAFRIVCYRWTIPLGFGYFSLSQIFVVVGYMTAIFVWAFINSRNIVTNQDLDIKYWSDRAGHIAAVQLPFIVALSSKNNIISLLTGISYEHLSLLHRMAARTVLALIWVHASARIQLGLTGNDSLTEPWVRVGLTTAAALSVLVLFSIRPIRHYAYELFYLTHITLVVIVLCGAYYHCINAGDGYGYYVWPAFILWPLERLLRLAHSLMTLRPQENVVMTLVSPSVVRLDIYTPRWKKWQAGQHVFINIPSISKHKTQAHPFTIANAYLGEDRVPRMTFLVKSKRGMTRTLLNHVKAHSSQAPLKAHAIVDGPYGIVPDFHDSHCLILIAGGTGCALTFPILEKAVSDIKKGLSRVNRVIFIWSLRDSDADIDKWLPDGLDDILNRPVGAVIEGTNTTYRVQIHVTSSYDDVNSLSEEPSTPSLDSPIESVIVKKFEKASNVHMGRADLSKILIEEIDKSSGAVSVYASGPPSIVSAVRNELTRWTGVGTKPVRLTLDETCQLA